MAAWLLPWLCVHVCHCHLWLTMNAARVFQLLLFVSVFI